MQSFTPRRWTLFGGIALLAAAAMVVTSLQVAQADPPTKKLQRELRLFERIMDDMLIDSPYWLVPGRENTRAYHVPGHGVLVTFQASLVSERWNGNWSGNGFSLRFWDRDDDDYYWDDDDDWDDDERDKDRRKSRRERRSTRVDRLYDRGKEEIADIFLDFPDSFDSVSDNEWVKVVVYLDSDVFYDQDIRRLEMSARVSDLKAYDADRIDESAFIDKIVVEEY